MAWLWTDELAHLLIESDGTFADELVGWIERPVAIRVDDAAATMRVLSRTQESEPRGA